MSYRKFGFTLLPDAKWDAEYKRLKATPEAIEKAVRNELMSMAVFIRNHIIRNMRSTPKTGRKYRKTKNKNIYHTSSSPGYAPAVDTGDLVKSIKMDVRANEVEVGSNLTGKDGKYPTFLEYGTKNMAARPWLEPAFDAGKMDFYSHIRSRVIQAIRHPK